MTTPAPFAPLLAALTALRALASGVPLPLQTPGAPAARKTRGELVAQLEDYVLPRLRQIDAPLLAVVGGSTGAGKSTLVNSVVGAQVTTAGVLRPTTRAPVLVHHPDDERWFRDPRILPGLSRTTGASADPGTLQLVATAALPSGLALLDAPDIDSVVTANRELAGQLLAAADLWLFVTTAARYADAVPWDLLRTAVERSTAVSVVLDRVPPEAIGEIEAHLAGMLLDQGLGAAPLFVVPETPPRDGLLPPEAVAPLRGWLRGLAADAAARAAVVRQTLDGALDSLSARVPILANRVAEQASAAVELRRAVESAYDAALHEVDEATTDGSLLRGEVLARWQEFVGTGELLRTLEARIGWLRDRVTSALRGRPAPADELTVALESGVEALVRASADAAAERTAGAWGRHPAGAALLAGGRSDDAPGERALDRSSPELPGRIQRAVRDWQGAVLELVRSEGQDRRSAARMLSYGVNGAGLLVMIAVFAHTGGLTGAEGGVAVGTSVLSQKLLEAVFGDQAVRSLAAKARADLHTRVQAVLAGEAARFLDRLEATGVDPAAASALRSALRAVEAER